MTEPVLPSISGPAEVRYPEHEKLNAPVGNLFDHDPVYGESRPWKVKDESNYVLGPFLDWLTDKATLAEWKRTCDNSRADHGEGLFVDADLDECPECGSDRSLTSPRLYAIHKGVEAWLAEYYEVDRQKLSDEKDAMLRAIRNEVPK